MMVHTSLTGTLKLKGRKPRYIKRKAPQLSSDRKPAPYRADDHRRLPSVLERRCTNERWQSIDDDEALAILNKIIAGDC